MKKLVVSFILVMVSLGIQAQVPEKKKDSRPPSRGQERAINESGVSVKSEPSKTTKSKSSQPASSKEEKKKKEEKSKDVKKPE